MAPAAAREPAAPQPGAPHALPHAAQARPDHGPHAAQQIAVALQASADGRIELRLDPAELGPVRVALEPGDRTMVVHVAADRGETLDLLRRHADQLARELREIGYRDVSFDFGSDRRPDGRAPQDFYGGGRFGAGHDDPVPDRPGPHGPSKDRPIPARPGPSGSGLDLRL